MCIAIPGQIEQITLDSDEPIVGLKQRTGTINIMGVSQEVSLALCPQAKVGDFVLIHAGTAIDVVSAEAAQETAELLSEISNATSSQTA